MTVPDVDRVRDRLAAVRRRIDAVDRPWGHPVEVMLVTKGFDATAIEVAADVGATVVGENYAQELLSKTEVLADLDARGCRPDVAFIGRLQSNKVRQIADVVDLWASVDRPSLVAEIARRAPGASLLVQVNPTDERGKGGCPLDDVEGIVDRARREGLDVRGLMAVGPTGAPPDAARAGFVQVRRLVDELGLDVCSIGMSADLDVAVEEGSTQVRLGTAVFGPRS